MPKTEYTQDDYIRALLRSAISTANNRLESILNKHLDGTIFVKEDGNGGVFVDYRNIYSGQAFDKTYACLNNKFFYSAQNDTASDYIAQAFTILSKGKKFGDQITDYLRYTGPTINLDPDLLAIATHYNEKYRKGMSDYIAQHQDDSSLSFQDLCVKAEKAQPKLKGEDYEESLIRRGFEGRNLQQAKLMLDVLGKQYSQSRIIDFLDTYTLYHYYLFRDAINKRFMDYIESVDCDMRSKQLMFEKIVQQEVKKHCASAPCSANAFFNRKYMSFAPRRIDSKRAKSLSLDIMDGTGGTNKLLRAQLQQAVNVSVPQGSEITIEDFAFRSKAKVGSNMDDKEKRKTLESARLLTSINCGMTHNGEYTSLVDNDFYAYSVMPGQNYKPQRPEPKPKQEPQQPEKPDWVRKAEEQKEWVQLTIFK